MVVKFFSNKKGGSCKAIDYLLNQREQLGTARVLQGDQVITRKIINSIHHKQKVTVGCLNFEENNLSDKKKREIMEDFEKTLLAGAEKSDYNILWVEHTDKKNTELNFVIPKIHLKSKKTLNPYFHKADMKRVDLWQSKTNLENDFSNPKDPNKQRTLETHKINHISNDYEQLDKLLHNLVKEEKIKNREHLKELLKDNDYTITRSGKDYISIKTPESKRATKFKGGIYSEKFRSIESLGEISKDSSRKTREYNQRDLSRELERIREQLDKQIRYKSEKFEQQYSKESQPTVRKSKEKTNSKLYADISNKFDNRDNLNIQYKALSDTKREQFESSNIERVQRRASNSEAEQQRTTNNIEQKQSKASNIETGQRRTKNMASTKGISSGSSTRKVYRDTREEYIYEERGQNLHQDKELNNDSTRTTTHGRNRERETEQFKSYSKARDSRNRVYQSLRRDNTELQERVRQLRAEQQKAIKQSVANIEAIKPIKSKLRGYSRLKERASSYIRASRKYIIENYNNCVRKFNDLKHQLDSSRDFFQSTFKQTKKLNFNDAKRAVLVLNESIKHNEIESKSSKPKRKRKR